MKKPPSIIKEIKKFSPKEINFSAGEKIISFSQLSMYNSCPHRWSLQYKEGIKAFTSSIHTVFGTAIHNTIQHYLTILYDKSGAAADRENLIEIFENNLREEYKAQYKKNNDQHFSSSEELREFYEDGVEIINYIKKKRNRYFGKKGWFLAGCEIPVLNIPDKSQPNLIYQGFLDLVLYHEATDKFKIIDIKTSTNSWTDYQKKDENKQAQLLLYKKYFSEQFNIPIENIDIEFFILKRKIYHNPDFPISRIQTFSPASGKNKVNKATQMMDDFIKEAFKFGDYNSIKHEAKINNNCKFCPFFGKELCPSTFSKN